MRTCIDDLEQYPLRHLKDLLFKQLEKEENRKRGRHVKVLLRVVRKDGMECGVSLKRWLQIG